MTEKQETVFVIQHTYSIKPDENLIDRDMGLFSYENEQQRAIDNAQYHRIFRAIANNQRATQRLMVYFVLEAHSAETGESIDFVAEHFNQENITFPDILLSMAPIFDPEDREWIQETKEDSPEAADALFSPLRRALGGGYDFVSGSNVESLGWTINKVQRVQNS